MRSSLYLSCLFGLSIGCTVIPTLSAAERIEAELTVDTTIHDASAFAGAASTATQAWQPLLRMPAPPVELATANLWIRQRGGPVQAKCVVGNTQTEQDWRWGQPKNWTWVNLGTFSAETVVDGVVVIRGNVSNDPNPAIDAALWQAPNAAAPEDPAVIPAVTLTMPFSKVIAKADKHAYGINAFRGFDAATVAKQGYQDGIKRLDVGLVRFHSAESTSGKGVNSWIDASTNDWNAQRITAALSAFPRENRDIMINICDWPAAYDADHDGFLDANRFDDYAALCANLVSIINIDGKFSLTWWEITNERDNKYHNDLVKNGQPSRINELADIYNRAAIAMKAVDPSIKTGGPALMRPDLTDSLRQFIRATKANLDFVTYHAYASGTTDDSDEYIFGKRVAAIGEAVGTIDVLIRSEMPADIPHFLDEYNIAWTWETREPRMTTHKGAIFDALVMAAAISAGAKGTCAWNEYDGIYGKLGRDFEQRPQVSVFHYLNTWGRGDVMAHSLTATDPNTAPTEASDMPVVAYCIQQADHRLLMLINRANYSVTCQGLPTAVTETARVDETGTHTDIGMDVSIPRHSVSFYRWAAP